jgi:hypothetical protein
MDKALRYFILFVAVLCLCAGSEAGFFDNVSRHLSEKRKKKEYLKLKNLTIGKTPY